MPLKNYDVLIVGTGASGGLAAKVLTEQGLEVLLLEAGPKVDLTKFLTHSWPYEFPFSWGGKSNEHQQGWQTGRGRAHSLRRILR